MTNSQNEIFFCSWCFALRVVLVQVLDCQYKSQFYLSWWEILFSILLTANEDVKQKL